MSFDFTPEEAQSIAVCIEKHMQDEGFTVARESPYEDEAPYRCTLLCKKKALSILIEAQDDLQYHEQLRDLSLWMAARDKSAMLYIATKEMSQVHLKVLKEMRSDGVGLFVIDSNGTVREEEKAANHVLKVVYAPQLKFGTHASSVVAAVDKFNRNQQKDGFNEIADMVEEETYRLAIKSQAKQKLNKTEAEIGAMSWENLLNVLEHSNHHHPNKPATLTAAEVRDLKAFKDGRNLFKHPVLKSSEIEERNRKAKDRMQQGGRLLHELLAKKRGIR